MARVNFAPFFLLSRKKKLKKWPQHKISPLPPRCGHFGVTFALCRHCHYRGEPLFSCEPRAATTWPPHANLLGTFLFSRLLLLLLLPLLVHTSVVAALEKEPAGA